MCQQSHIIHNSYTCLPWGLRFTFTITVTITVLDKYKPRKTVTITSKAKGEKLAARLNHNTSYYGHYIPKLPGPHGQNKKNTSGSLHKLSHKLSNTGLHNLRLDPTYQPRTTNYLLSFKNNPRDRDRLSEKFIMFTCASKFHSVSVSLNFYFISSCSPRTKLTW